MKPPYMHYAFQPIYDIKRSGTNPTIYGYEALMRPEGMDPNKYIDIAEKEGKLHDVEYSTFYNAIDQFMDRGLNGKLFVNSLPYEKLDDEEIESLTDLAPEECYRDLYVEILERGANVSIISMINKLHYLRIHGFPIALDDFGTGISSVKALKILNPEIVKIDRSFITDIDKDTRKLNMLEIMIHSLRSHEVKILGEGVETQAEFDCLKDFDVDYMQGYFLGMPE